MTVVRSFVIMAALTLTTLTGVTNCCAAELVEINEVRQPLQNLQNAEPLDIEKIAEARRERLRRHIRLQIEDLTRVCYC